MASQSDPPSDTPTLSITPHEDEKPWLELIRLADLGDASSLADFVSSLSTLDQALALSRLQPDEMESVLGTLDPMVAATLISHLSETQAAQAVGFLGLQSAAAIVGELPADEQADVLGELDEEQAQAIIESLPSAEAEAVRELVAYEVDVAGGLMTSDVVRFRREMTVAEVIDQLSRQHEEHHDFDVRYAYVCDSDERLIGVLPMRNLLFVRRSSTVDELMIRNPLSILDQTPLEELIEVFDSHGFLGIPVVDSDGALKGVVHREAVDHAAARMSESDYLKSQGIVGGEELRTMPLWLRSRRRLSWLSVNILLNVGAAGVVALYQETLQAVIALAVFLPIISDMSGCSGNQAVAVSMREIALGLVRPADMLRVWIKELGVGMINGLVLGSLVALGAILIDGNAYLGLVVGAALFINTIVAVSIGGTVPLLLKRFKFDPAVASGPLLTTVTDMCGFFLVLGLATIFLSRLI